MKQIRKLNSLLKAKNISLTAIDGTGLDSWQRSRHYERRIWEVHAPHMPYAKVDLFIDVKTQQILDFSLEVKRIHDAKAAGIIFKQIFKGKDLVLLGMLMAALQAKDLRLRLYLSLLTDYPYGQT